ncbi:hypothetical protein [Patiriisocius marinistellae]|nr:hypothetical protein [Patiriisocius marinistellae]
MRYYIFHLFILLYSTLSLGQTVDDLQEYLDNVDKVEPVYSMQSEFLVPDESLLNSDAYQIRYYQKLKEILFEGLPNSYDTRFLSLPSFHEEEVLLLRNDTLYYNTVNIKIWHVHYNEILDNKPELDTVDEKIKLEKHIGKLSNNDAELLKKLYRAVLSKARYRIFSPEEMNRLVVGNDGTSYNFSISNYEQKDGSTWSPKKDSKMYRLVEIHKKLIQTLKESRENNQILLKEKLQNKIKTLIDEVNLSEFEFEKNTVRKVKDTIVSHLNKNFPTKRLAESMEFDYVADDFIFTIENGKIVSVNFQEVDYEGYSEKELIEIKSQENKLLNEYKKALSNLDLRYLNLELNLKIYIDLTYDDTDYILKEFIFKINKM